MDAFLRGVLAYRRHPYRRAMPEPPTIWRCGGTRLLDYGGDGPPLLAVPSLVNRATILDLTPKRSLMRYLAGRGLRVLMVDWDAPGEAEAGFGLTEYILGRLVPAFDAAAALTGQVPMVLGYCMGGLLALALAARRPVKALALMATPWDFHDPDRARLMRAVEPMIGPAITAAGSLPVDMLQIFFAAIDPPSIGRKFRALAAMPPRGAKARDFVALEDWLNDGVPLAAEVARECLFGWYGRNDPALGRWCIAGEAVRPQDISAPSLVMVPLRDRIVPPASALPLAESLPQARLMRLDAGHIGMVTGRRAKTEVYGPLSRWLVRQAKV
ncbi:MAG: alpha/beta fold hydrolase [Rhodospirillales bacterium]|nr:alpha/beta fold hydrolase [Rhodospirillales bacterium]